MECCEDRSGTVGENSCASKSSMLTARLAWESNAFEAARVEERAAIGAGRIMRLLRLLCCDVAVLRWLVAGLLCLDAIAKVGCLRGCRCIGGTSDLSSGDEWVRK
jgi:hypothetical protein